MLNIYSTVGKYDVVSSQGVKTVIPNNEGNNLFAEMIARKAPLYRYCTTRAQKQAFTKECVTEMQEKYDSKFLRPEMVQTNNNNSRRQTKMRFVELSHSQARDKVSHALRFQQRSRNASPTASPSLRPVASRSEDRNVTPSPVFMDSETTANPSCIVDDAIPNQKAARSDVTSELIQPCPSSDVYYEPIPYQYFGNFHVLNNNESNAIAFAPTMEPDYYYWPMEVASFNAPNESLPTSQSPDAFEELAKAVTFDTSITFEDDEMLFCAPLCFDKSANTTTDDAVCVDADKAIGWLINYFVENETIF